MTLKNREAVFEEASTAVNGSRNEEYGEPFSDFTRTARMWTAMFGYQFVAEDVAKALIVLKLGRLAHTPSHFDSWVDIAGYAACGWDAHLDRMDEHG